MRGWGLVDEVSGEAGCVLEEGGWEWMCVYDSRPWEGGISTSEDVSWAGCGGAGWRIHMR